MLLYHFFSFPFLVFKISKQMRISIAPFLPFHLVPSTLVSLQISKHIVSVESMSCYIYGWQMGGLGHKWVWCIITHLSIYDPFIYKLIIHYPPNSFN